MNEQILGFIKCEAMGKYYDLYFTSNRMIAAKTASPIGWFIAFGAIVGAIGAGIAKLTAKKRSEQLKNLSAESIFKADKKNFEIPYAEITKVEMKKAGIISEAKISIFTHTKKYVFIMWKKKEFDAYESLVRSVLPDRLSIS